MRASQLLTTTTAVVLAVAVVTLLAATPAECGRSVAPTESWRPFRSRTWTNVLPEFLVKRLEEDIRAVSAYEAQFKALKNNKKHTRWFPIDATPRTAMEEVILMLRDYAQPGRRGVGVAGAEWWVQTVSADEKGEIGFHVDKDEAVASEEHYLMHPELGSILYLTDVGGCTLILDQWSPFGNGYEPARAAEADLVCPQRNKYAVFDGKLLHGVVPGKRENRGQTRMTFLVNWWPQAPKAPNCKTLPHAEVPGLRLLSAEERAALRAEIEAAPRSRKRQPAAVMDMRASSKTPVKATRFNYGLPGGRRTHCLLPDNLTPGGTFELRWDPNQVGDGEERDL